MSRSVSMESIAQKLGVSAMTVSRVLNAQTPPTRRDALEAYHRIRRVAKELGYRKSTLPQSMVTGKYRAITLLVGEDWDHNHVPPNRLNGLITAANRHGMKINFAMMPDECLEEETAIPAMLQNWNSDGLLVAYVTSYPEMLDEILTRYRIPSIWLNSKHKADCIYPDDWQGSFDATAYLQSLGHRRIAYWFLEEEKPEIQHHYSVVDRQSGYLEAMSRAGLKPMQINAGGKIRYADYDAFLIKCLKAKNRPTAVIAYTPAQAIAVIRAANRVGLSVPEDLSVITFSDDASIYQLTTMLIPEKQLGERAIDLIIKKVERPQKAIKPVPMALELNLKTITCAPPPGE